MADGKVTIESEIDDKGISQGIKNIKDKLRSLDSGLIKTAALGAAINIAPAALPAVAALTGGVLALSSAFAAAGIGVIGFGAVAIPTLTDIFEANQAIADAEEKLAKADTAKERAAAMEELRLATMGLSDAQKEALGSLQEFQTFWDGFAKSFETPVVQAFGKSLDALKGVLELSKPAIKGAADGINTLLDSLNRSLGTSEVKAFFEYVGKDAGPAIVTFGQIAGNVLLGFMNLMRAFSPLSNDMQGGLLELTQGFADWTAGLSQSKAFQEFVDYVRENGPKLLSLIGNITMLIIEIGKALAPLGSAVLDVLNVVIPFITSLIEGNPVIASIGIAISQLSGAFMFLAPIILNIAGIVNKFIGWIASLFTKVDGTAKGITMLRTALTAITGPIGIVIAAVTGLVAIFISMWKTNEEFRTKVTTIWNSISTVISTVITTVGAFIMEIWTQIKAFWDENQASILAAAQNVWNVIQTVINTALTVIMIIFQVVWPLIKMIVVSTWEAIKNVVQGAINVILGIIKFFSALFTGDWQGLWDSIKQILSGALELIWGLVQIGFLGKIFKVIKGFAGKAVDAIKNMGSKIKGWFEDLYLKALYKWDDIKSAIMTPILNAKNKVIGYIEDLYLKALYKWDDLRSAATSKFNSIKKAIMDPIRKAVDFIKRQVDKIRGFFNGLKIRLPKIKLPHFSLRGKLDLVPPGLSVPKLSVNWYKNGGVFPANSPRLVGIGDASVPEAALPLKPSVLGMIGQKIADTMTPPTQISNNGVPVSLAINLNGKVIARETWEDITKFQNDGSFADSRFIRG
ncbi:phage-related protein [Bacillus pakistanensis]|uniref:Phage-related protein n=1 Tax=Rossellomorea pakistanensis TaxID=992288 RepID=A0ABS2NDB9_9BACI|nr:hypothetical protein [Bacillus pakistanensis]MBM7585852.1 phage-related protein [Bacillus pakistanensis]